MEHVHTSHSLSFGRLFNETIKFFKENFKELMLINASVLIPINLLLAYLAPSIGYIQGSEQAETFTASAGIFTLVYLLLTLLTVFSTACYINAKHKGKKMEFAEALQEGLSKYPPTFGTVFLGLLLLIPLFILLVIPGLIFSIYWTFGMYYPLMRNKSGMGALKESKKLVKGHWWTVFGYSLAGGIIGGIALIIVGIPFEILASVVAETPAQPLVSGFLSGIMDSLSAIFIVFSTLFFFDLEKTKGHTEKS